MRALLRELCRPITEREIISDRQNHSQAKWKSAPPLADCLGSDLFKLMNYFHVNLLRYAGATLEQKKLTNFL